MTEYTLAIAISLVVAAIMVYFVDKKFGGENEGN
jgi:hypothetical protein